MLSAITKQRVVAQTLRRSLESGRLAHASIFIGSDEQEMEDMVVALAQTLHCENPPSRSEQSGLNTDACGVCRNCRLIAERKHPDVQWIYPESKIRIITTDQIRRLIESSRMRSFSGGYEIAVLCGADRLNLQAANAFLKTLEEPVPGKLFILLTREVQKIIPTILSRCRRFIFEGINRPVVDEGTRRWVQVFAETAAGAQTGILSRYSLLAPMVARLAELQEVIKDELTKASPLVKYTDVEEGTRERWEKELQAAIDSEYRRQRGGMLSAIELWLRDVWLTCVVGHLPEVICFPDLSSQTTAVAKRLNEIQAAANLEIIGETRKTLDTTNVQEALTLEVFLLKLAL